MTLLSNLNFQAANSFGATVMVVWRMPTRQELYDYMGDTITLLNNFTLFEVFSNLDDLCRVEIQGSLRQSPPYPSEIWNYNIVGWTGDGSGDFVTQYPITNGDGGNGPAETLSMKLNQGGWNMLLASFDTNHPGQHFGTEPVNNPSEWKKGRFVLNGLNVGRDSVSPNDQGPTGSNSSAVYQMPLSGADCYFPGSAFMRNGGVGGVNGKIPPLQVSTSLMFRQYIDPTDANNFSKFAKIQDTMLIPTPSRAVAEFGTPAVLLTADSVSGAKISDNLGDGGDFTLVGTEPVVYRPGPESGIPYNGV